MRIDESGEQIVGRGDGVKIAVKMEINFRAGLDLRKATTRGTAFHSKDGAERRLARGNDDFLADVGEALRQADGSDGLAFSRGRGGGRSDDDQFSTALECGVGEQLQLDFSALRSPLFKIFFRNFEFACYRLNRKKRLLHKSYEFCS